MPDEPPKQHTETDIHRRLGAIAGAASETAVEMAHEYGSMGLGKSKFQLYGNATAMLVIILWMSVGAPVAFFWLRSDAKEDRSEMRLSVIRAEQLAEERRREDRMDRQRLEDLFKTTLDLISRDSREQVTQMKVVSEQVKGSAAEMKAASDAMIRIEKLLTAKKEMQEGPRP